MKLDDVGMANLLEDVRFTDSIFKLSGLDQVRFVLNFHGKRILHRIALPLEHDFEHAAKRSLPQSRLYLKRFEGNARYGCVIDELIRFVILFYLLMLILFRLVLLIVVRAETCGPVLSILLLLLTQIANKLVDLVADV